MKAVTVALQILISSAYILGKPAEDGGACASTCDQEEKVTEHRWTQRHRQLLWRAGPAGLQLGHLLNLYNRSYRIFERASTVGSFFSKYPIHRRLISVNKRHTGRSNKEYNLRHDWNSLLDNDKVPRMPQRTSDRFPHADVLVEYLKDYAEAQIADDKIQFNTTVTKIARHHSSMTGFELSLHHTVEDIPADESIGPDLVFCEFVIVASGIGQPRKPPIDGIEYALGYEDSNSGYEDRWEGKAVGIFGAGNAAFEVADAAANRAAWVHMFGLRKAALQRRFSWETRYSGGLRATRISLLDGYLLKSGDLFTDTGIASAELKIAQCQQTRCGLAADEKLDPFNKLKGRLVLFKTYAKSKKGPSVRMIQVGEISVAGGEQHIVENLLEEWSKRLGFNSTVWEWSYLDPKEYAVAQFSVQSGSSVKSGAFREDAIIGIALPAELLNGDRVDKVVQMRHELQNLDFTDLYDVIVYATGWLHDTSIYDSSVTPKLQSNRRLPHLRSGYESSVDGMFFAGTLAHGFDLRRGAGGFIGGFRYSSRAIFRHLQERFENVPWPHERFRIPQDIDNLASRLVRRINEASGPYQMVYTIGDCVSFVLENDQILAIYKEEVPFNIVVEQIPHNPILFWTFGFEFGQVATLTESLGDGTGFRPSITYWSCDDNRVFGGWSKTRSDHQERPRRKQLFRLNESYNFKWAQFAIIRALTAWLKAITAPMISTKSLCVSMTQIDMSSAVDGLFDHSVVDISPGNFEIDVVFVNSFEDNAVRIVAPRIDPDTIGGRRTEGRIGLIELDVGEASQRLLTFDGEVWTVSVRNLDGTFRKSFWTAVAENGVVQEVEVTSNLFPEDAISVDTNEDFNMRFIEDDQGCIDSSMDESNIDMLRHCKSVRRINFTCSDAPTDFAILALDNLVFAEEIVVHVNSYCRLSVQMPNLRKAGLLQFIVKGAVEDLFLPLLRKVTVGIEIVFDCEGESKVGYRSVGELYLGGSEPLSVGRVVIRGNGTIQGMHLDNCERVGLKAGVAIEINGDVDIGSFSINQQADPVTSLSINGDVKINKSGCETAVQSIEILELYKISGSFMIQNGGGPSIVGIKFVGHGVKYPITNGVFVVEENIAREISVGYYGKHSSLRRRSVLLPPVYGTGSCRDE